MPVRGDPSESALGLRLHLRGEGWVHYVAFVIDASRGASWAWASMRTDFVLDALEGHLRRRGDALTGLVHHSDRGTQYHRYTDRLAAAGIAPSVGKGDAFDNALAESVIGLYKRR